MPPGVGPRESLALVLLYQTGAHLEALARALGRDVRTVRKVLRQAGVQLRTDPPLPPDWRAGLPRDTVAALEAYRTAVAQCVLPTSPRELRGSIAYSLLI
jgi:hypothetical protein